MKNLLLLLLVAISVFFIADLAAATGGADSYFPFMRVGGYLLHLVAILVGIVGLILAKKDYKLMHKIVFIVKLAILKTLNKISTG